MQKFVYSNIIDGWHFQKPSEHFSSCFHFNIKEFRKLVKSAMFPIRRDRGLSPATVFVLAIFMCCGMALSIVPNRHNKPIVRPTGVIWTKSLLQGSMTWKPAEIVRALVNLNYFLNKTPAEYQSSHTSHFLFQKLLNRGLAWGFLDIIQSHGH